MTTAGNFLLPDATLYIECIVFLVVLGVIGRAALPRLRAAVDDRQRELDVAEQTIQQAAAVRDEAAREAAAITTAARREARDIINRGQVRHDELVARGMRKGREEYEWMAGRTQREAARDAAPAPARSYDGRPSAVVVPSHPRS